MLVLTLCLSTLVTAAPVSLAGAPRAATLLAQELPPPPPTPPPSSELSAPGVGLSGSLAEIDAQLEELRASRPGLGGPIALLVSGAVAVIVAVVFVEFALLAALVGAVNPYFYVALIAGIAGAALLVTGGILLGAVLRERKAISRDLRDLEARRKALLNAPAQLPPPPPSPVTEAPLPGLQLARF